MTALCRVVLIVGEPGDRQVSAAGRTGRSGWAGERFWRLRLFCSPHTTHTPTPPGDPADRARRRLPPKDDPPAERATKLRARLESGEATAEYVALITALLRLPGDGLPSLNLSPQRRKERTFAALLRRVERMSAARPLLIIIRGHALGGSHHAGTDRRPDPAIERLRVLS